MKKIGDKTKHFIATSIISLLVLVLFVLFYNNPTYGWDKMIAIGVACLAALGKEVIWDKWLKRGTPEFYDFLAGVHGAFVTTFLWIIIETFFF